MAKFVAFPHRGPTPYAGPPVAVRDYLDGFVQLHRIPDPDERNSEFRQAFATLAALVADHRRALPLEGLDPEELERSILLAQEAGWLDATDWLSGPASAAAIYELASALPPGDLKRDLGRKVLRRLHVGDAATFVAVATQLAEGSRRALGGAAMRARVALALDLPIGAGARADGLALALISRRELSREWLTIPATGSLPARRLAARLLERAAREAAHRAAEGDDGATRVFDIPNVRDAWEKLLADRESLVWRHVAAARGLLSYARPEFEEEIERHLSPGLGVTEWRRAAASLAASIAAQGEYALDACRELLGSDIAKRDKGIPASMVQGLPRAAEAEPQAVEELLEQLIRVGGLPAAEALVELRRERLGEGFGEWAARTAAAQLKDMLSNDRPSDHGDAALALAVTQELFPASDTPSLRQQVDAALDAFVEGGAMAASAEALAVLEAAEKKVALLEQCTGDADSMERMTSFRALRELDVALLESDTMANLLALGSRGEEPGAELRPLGDLFQRMTNWLVIHEGKPIQNSDAVDAHFTQRLRRTRALLHLVDADGRRVDDRVELRDKRRVLTAQTLLRRVAEDAPSRLRRATLAAAARACDALVREEVAEVSDIVLAAGRASNDPGDLYTMSEAAMMPDLENALLAFAKLQKTLDEKRHSGRTVRAALDALAQLAHDLPVASSPRVEALRHGLLDLAASLEPIAGASSLHGLAELSRGDTPLAALEAAVQTIATLVMGARRRLGEAVPFEKPSCGPAVRMIDLYLERALRVGEERDLTEAIRSAAQSFEEELPAGFAQVASLSLANLAGLPLEGEESPRTSFLPAAPKEAPLPAWMPPSRVLGGFYVTRAIGNGAVGSVFVARRVDARHDPTAEQFALKVPEYSGAAARTLSEDEFMRLFRDEAGALLSLPRHANIARFVTFDAGARPKPILVMELVDGPSLERYLDGAALDMPRALELLDGVAAGLEAMHKVGVAHLDVKPSNVIVRDPDGILGPKLPDEPVLVDFGLAGRGLRPGCGTASYGAPEVWGHDESGKARAEPADVYAFGCLAFELLTGKTLFEENNDMATLHAHLQHDGWPEKVGRLTTDPRTQGLAELIRRSIRRNPDDRETMTSIRGALGRLRPGLSTLEWPIRA